MRTTFFAFAAASLLAVLVAPAVAADAAPPASYPVREACAADFTKFCAGHDPRSDAGRACIRQHRAEFTPACQSAMDARRQERQERMARIKAACSADIAKFCSGSSQTDERPGRCLRDHKDELSESCKAALPDRTAKPQ